MGCRKGGVGPVLAIAVLGFEKARKLGRQQRSVGAPRVVAGLQAPVGLAQVDNLDKGAGERFEPRQPVARRRPVAGLKARHGRRSRRVDALPHLRHDGGGAAGQREPLDVPDALLRLAPGASRNRPPRGEEEVIGLVGAAGERLPLAGQHLGGLFGGVNGRGDARKALDLRSQQVLRVLPAAGHGRGDGLGIPSRGGLDLQGGDGRGCH